MSLLWGSKAIRRLLQAIFFIQKFSDDDFIMLLLYVDDMLIVDRNISRINSLKKQLSESFTIKDLGPTKQILGMKIVKDRGIRKL